MTPLINGTAYSWVGITFLIGGTEIVGIDAISYDDDQEIEDNLGAGRYVVSRGYGAVKCTASITLHQKEIQKLKAQSPTGRLQDIPTTDIQVAYAAGDEVFVDTLHNVDFKKNMANPKSGDKKLAVELPLQISHVTWGRS